MAKPSLLTAKFETAFQSFVWRHINETYIQIRKLIRPRSGSFKWIGGMLFKQKTLRITPRPKYIQIDLLNKIGKVSKLVFESLVLWVKHIFLVTKHVLLMHRINHFSWLSLQVTKNDYCVTIFQAKNQWNDTDESLQLTNADLYGIKIMLCI